MKTLKIRLMFCFIVLFISSGMISCSKNTGQSSDNENKIEKTKVEQDDFAEKDEDLLNVDYKEFYDVLAPHGEWIEVTDKDINEVMKNETSSAEVHKKISFAELFGINDAYANDLTFGTFFVWKPAPEIAISYETGVTQPMYVPYTHGNWTYTDAGWYFMAPTDYEEVTHHYGRWYFSPAMGWVWVPGRVWAPAWVDWRENDEYLAWEPLPPRVYIVDNILSPPPVYEDRYIIVEKKYFYEPNVYYYTNFYNNQHANIRITEMRSLDGIIVVNNSVVNKGPDIVNIEKIHGTKIDVVKINKVKDIGNNKFDGKELYSYYPQFNKVKITGESSGSVLKPDKYNKFSEVKHNRSNTDNLTLRKNNNSHDNNFNEKIRPNSNRNDKQFNERTDNMNKNRNNNEQKFKKNDRSDRKRSNEKQNYKDNRRNENVNKNNSKKNNSDFRNRKENGKINKERKTDNNDKWTKNNSNRNYDKSNSKGRDQSKSKENMRQNEKRNENPGNKVYNNNGNRGKNK